MLLELHFFIHAGPAMGCFGKKYWGLLAAVLLTSAVWAQTSPVSTTTSIPLAYRGDTTQLSVGYDQKTKVNGELQQVLSADDRSAWIGEGWIGQQVGGVKLNRHWLISGEGNQTNRVGKLFAAWDRNQYGDQKYTFGGGQETQDVFWALYASVSPSGRRQVGQSDVVQTQTVNGVDTTYGAYLQDITTTTTTRYFERAYRYGVGGRLGHFYEPELLRLTGGLDHEIGEGSASQTTVSLYLEKMFQNSPHSIGVSASVWHKQGDFEPVRNDHQIGVFWRYGFGGNAWQPTSRQMAVRDTGETPAATSPSPAPAAQGEPTRALPLETRQVSADVYFDLNGSILTPTARQTLSRIAQDLQQGPSSEKVFVTGHTCDLGPAAYNQHLSEKRAGAVREFLMTQGIDPERIQVEGKGEADPRYPNTRAQRPLNRRCDIEYRIWVTPPIKAQEATPVVAPVSKPAPLVRETETEGAQPAWEQRALYNPVRHKRTVDVYQSREVSTTVSEGQRRYTNRPPVAVDDVATLRSDQLPALINVLANDSDPDGDALKIVSVTQGSQGQVQIAGDRLQYQAPASWTGTDVFTYTITDGKGQFSTARVTVTVAAANRAPIAVDDAVTVSSNQLPVLINVLANDSDPDGDPLRVTALTTPAHGQATISGNRISYQAQSGWTGTDSFTYTITDDKGGTASARVVVTVTPVNRPPVAVDDAIFWYGSSMPAVINVLANDSDPDGDPLTVIAVTQASNGSVQITGDGKKVSYHSRAGWGNAVDKFTYTISDGRGGTATATVTVTVLDP